jgi:hypothetical protein
LKRAVDFLDSIVVAAERNGSRGVKARSFPTASLPSRPHEFYFTGDDGAGVRGNGRSVPWPEKGGNIGGHKIEAMASMSR